MTNYPTRSNLSGWWAEEETRSPEQVSELHEPVLSSGFQRETLPQYCKTENKAERHACQPFNSTCLHTCGCAPAHKQAYTHTERESSSSSWEVHGFRGHGSSCPKDIAAGGWLLAHTSADQEAGSPSRKQDQFTTHKAYFPSNPLPLSRPLLKVPQPPETTPQMRPPTSGYNLFILPPTFKSHYLAKATNSMIKE